jgi:hypothetical protein
MLYPINEKTVMVDDTCNFISCKNESEANVLFSILTDERTNIFLESIIFWDSKRPITTEILNSIDLRKIANEKYLDKQFSVLMSYNKTIDKDSVIQMGLL